MTRTARRVACLVALVLVIAALGAPVPNAGATPQTPVSVTPVIAIDLHSLFGDENEPDENEPDEGGAGGGNSAQSSPGSGVSLTVTILLVLAAALAGGYVAIRVRRVWMRLRDWGSDLRARF